MKKLFILIACFINFQLLCMDTKEDTTKIPNPYTQAINAQADQIHTILNLMQKYPENKKRLFYCIAYNLEAMAALMESQLMDRP